MPRMRTLKPTFFSNDQLAEVHPLGRLLFQGLWCMADREGRLEDRPKRIKAEVLPYDNANVERLLCDLEARGFILRYCIGEDRFIQVRNFAKHQNPHVKEPPSTIPAPDEHGAGPMPDPTSPDENTSRAVSARVLSHGIQEQLPVQEPVASANGATSEVDQPSPGDDRVDEVYAHFKARIQPRSRLNPRKKIAARLKRFSVAELKQGIDHFADDPWWMEHNASQGAEWFFESDSRSEHFLLMSPRVSNVVPLGKQPSTPTRLPIDRTGVAN
jgi:hypothetical protein